MAVTLDPPVGSQQCHVQGTAASPEDHEREPSCEHLTSQKYLPWAKGPLSQLLLS